MRNRNLGFTLLELLVVIVIIGLLAGYVAPRYFSQVGKSEVAGRAGADRCARESARPVPPRQPRRYPSAERRAWRATCQAPYLQKSVPNDPWGRPYVYRTPAPRATSSCSPTAATASPAARAKTPTSAWAIQLKFAQQ